MTVKQWNAGDVLTASDMNVWTVPIVAIKPSDQTITSSTTLTNDTAMFASLAANSTYYFRLDLMIIANDTAQFKSQFTGPAGASLNCSMFGFNTGATFGQTCRTAFSTPVQFTGNGGTVVPLTFWGNVAAAGTAGTFQFQWAQQTSNGTGCTVKAGSQLLMWRIA